eukprot:7978856-Alexandrium_andersonii.AAC.1
MYYRSRLSRAKSKGVRGLRIGGLRIRAREIAISRPRTPSRLAFVGRFGVCANKGAESTSRGLQGPI